MNVPIFEIREMQSFTKGEATQVREFIAAHPEHVFRPPYDKSSSDHSHQSLRPCSGGEPYRSWCEVALLLRVDVKLHGTPLLCHACYCWHIKPIGVARPIDPIEPLVAALGY